MAEKKVPSRHYAWTVIGAGPAGIAAVGKLLDHGIESTSIAWIDPYFKVGDFGTRWRNIPSNTKVSLFLKFLHASKAFNYAACEHSFALNHAPSHETCYLNLMAEPLQWVTHQLMPKVNTYDGYVAQLAFHGNHWTMELTSGTLLSSKQVILAIGAEPKTLSFSDMPTIPLEDAMDATRIKKHLGPNDTIAIFGSSHSAILALKNLVEFGVPKIINFYRSPLLYAIYREDNSILFDDTGLKGSTAAWAKEYLTQDLPLNLMRIHSDDVNANAHLSLCTKVIYGIGFERRAITIEGFPDIQYDDQTGLIAPGLYGLGIAFPEAKMNALGMLEHRVGLWKFMEYIERVMPMWLGTMSMVIGQPPLKKVH